MLLKILRLIRGYVDFEAKGKFPERFLNLTVRNGINIWNTVPNESGLSSCMNVYDYKKIRKTAKKARVKCKVTSRHGLPFAVNKYKSRSGLFFGAVLSLVLIIFLSNFVWAINVQKTDFVSQQRVYSVLKDNGLYDGVWIWKLDTGKIERQTALTLKDIGWMSINITGTTARVEIKQKVDKPKLDENKTPCNLKASQDGVITKLNVKCGETKVLKGSGVAKGQLLVSGILDTKMQTINCVRSKGEIYADVKSKKQFCLPEKNNYSYICDEICRKYSCNLLWLNFPCSISFKNSENKVLQNNTKCLAGYDTNTRLPLSITTQRVLGVKEQEVQQNLKTAQTAFKNSMALYEIFDNSNKVLVSKNYKIKKDKTRYICTTDYVFNQNIAVISEISVTD